MEEKIDPIILGHNPFYGTDHLDAERGAQRATYFSQIDNVIKVIRWSQEEGVKGLMLSTHPNVNLILTAIKEEPEI